MIRAALPEHRPPPSGAKAPMHTVILGAGVVGVTTAYYLARRGHQVTVVDRQTGPGLETSFANGGLVTPSLSDPWAAPSAPLQMIQWLGQEDARRVRAPRR